MTEPTKQSGGSLAVRPDQTAWTSDQVAVLRQAGIKDEVTPAELSGFLHLCQRTGLDPFSRQIYLIGRWDGRAQREVYQPQTGIDGYRVVSHRAAREAGETVGYEDTLWCGEDGKWRDVWLSTAAPAAAKVTVIRGKQRFPAVAKYSEYVQTKKNGDVIGLWVKMPATMTAKCAESLALRMAFPHDLAGVYTAEEMGQASNPAAAPVEPDPWATPPPKQGTTRAGNGGVDPEAFVPHPEGQAFAIQARAAKDQAGIKALWALAVGVINSPVLAPDTQKPDVLGTYLTRLAKKLPEIAPNTDEDGVVDAELVEPSGPASAPQLRMMFALFATVGVAKNDREARLDATSLIVGRQIGTSNELTAAEAQVLLDTLTNFSDRENAAGDFADMVRGLLAAQPVPA